MNTCKAIVGHSIIALSLLKGTLLWSYEEKTWIEAISDDMQAFEKVATTTRRNQLYQPYILSVFEGEELERLGVATLEEALRLVPGVDIASDNFDYTTPIFRGSNPDAYGQSKLFIDGVVVNDLFFDGYSPYLSMPVEMIKRIEVVRGPGSRTDGVNAYAGSVHVVTYAEELDGLGAKNELVFKGGSDDYMMGGFVCAFHAGEVNVHADFSYQHDRKTLPAGPDAAYALMFGAANAHLAQSGEAPVWAELYHLGISAEYRGFSFKARVLDSTRGSGYGINHLLPDSDDRVKLPNYYVDLGYAHAWDNYELQLNAGAHFDRFDSRMHLSPPGLVLPSLTPPTTVVEFPEGFYGVHRADQRSLYQSTHLRYRGLPAHEITLGYRAVSNETTYQSTTTTDRDLGIGLVDYSETYPFLEESAKRDSLVLMLQDRFDYSDRLSFMYGLVAEKRTDMAWQADPRFSLVYQLDTRNILKAMLSHAHRNPSWQEMYTLNNRARVGNPELDSERVQAFELVYIRKFSTENYWETNLFYLNNRNQINKNNVDNRYANASDTEIYGLESELKNDFGSAGRLYLNYSFVRGSSDVDGGLAKVANHMVKGYYIYEPLQNLSLSGVFRYVGSKSRSEGDPRSDVDGYATFDVSARYDDAASGVSLALSVKNLFDADVVLPAPAYTYVNDYPQEGRSFIVTLKKSFR